MAAMRLRPRPPRAPERSLPDDWVQPRRSGRSTTIGNLDSPARAAVDPAGLVTVAGAPWSLDWWVGAEDRWHMPCREMAVRQTLVGASPVVETRLRVPSGDAVHRAYAARDLAGREAVVIEVENQSKAPFAVTFALRPHGQDEVGRIDSLELHGNTVTLDGQVVVVLPRSPGRVALSDAARGDAAFVVLAGVAAPVGPASVSCPAGLASGALMFPLAHTATLRIILPLAAAADDAALPEPAAFPAASEVASGWGVQSGRGSRVELPDPRQREAVAASVRHLLLAPPSPVVAAALDLMGFPDEAARLLSDAASDLLATAAPGALLHAVAQHWELTGDVAFAEHSVAIVGALVPRLARAADPHDQALGRAALPAAVRLLAAAGEARAASDVERTIAAQPAAAEPAAEPFEALLGSATGTWTWSGGGSSHDPEANADLVTRVRRQLVDVLDGGLALSPVVPAGGLGKGWELHDAPTRHGRLSYAVRWHGDRPAVLWHLEPHSAATDPVVITAPGLDPAWSTTELKGDALLAPVALPAPEPTRGVSMPVTLQLAPRGGRGDRP